MGFRRVVAFGADDGGGGGGGGGDGGGRYLCLKIEGK